MSFDLVIVGAGLAGLALACALRDTHLKIALIENKTPVSPGDWDARVYAISPTNADFLRQIGVWKHLDARRLAPIRAMRIIGDAEGRLDFSAYASGVPELGWIVESSLMANELWENAKRQANLTLFCPATVRALSFDDDAARLTLADGQVLATRLLVGADGRDSWVRTAAGLYAIDTPYNEHGVVANFTCEHPPLGLARQWFRKDGILAWLPLPGRRISMVWSTPNAHAQSLLSLSATELCAKVADAGGHELGEMSLLTSAKSFPLRLLRVPKIVAPRLALLGDAAHGLHPLSGHGINLGYQDVRVLSELLAATPSWQDVGDERLLRRYQRGRREETLLLQNATHALHQLFYATLPGFGPLRNNGLNLINALPAAKNRLVHYALGAF